MQNGKGVEDINNVNEGIGIGQMSVLKGLQSNICRPNPTPMHAATTAAE